MLFWFTCSLGLDFGIRIFRVQRLKLASCYSQGLCIHIGQECSISYGERRLFNLSNLMGLDWDACDQGQRENSPLEHRSQGRAPPTIWLFPSYCEKIKLKYSSCMLPNVIEHHSCTDFENCPWIECNSLSFSHHWWLCKCRFFHFIEKNSKILKIAFLFGH